MRFCGSFVPSINNPPVILSGAKDPTKAHWTLVNPWAQERIGEVLRPENIRASG